MEEGDIEALEEKWFDNGNCTTDDDSSEVSGCQLIVELMEEGSSEALEKKWFDNGNCTTDDDSTQVRDYQRLLREKAHD